MLVPKIIQGLYTRPVTDEDQLFLLLIIERDGKHPYELLHDVHSPAVITFQNDLGIAPRSERISFLLQLLPYLLEIVDLAVEVDDQPVFQVHGLVSQRGEIQDGKPALSKADKGLRRFIYFM